MPDLGTPLPRRRPELVSRPFAGNSSYLVRDRLQGESFQLGAEEHFLLARLNGTRTAQDLCAAFAERFGESLTKEELDDFLHLARERGFLQPDGMAATTPPGGNGFQDDSTPPHLRRDAGAGSPQQLARLKRLAARFLSAVAALLQWLAGLLSNAARKVQWVRLARLEFVPRPDDIFIVTYPRSGTTWMQMILYQLTTDGRMDFPHIAEYCPWFERSGRSARGFDTRPAPRLFKSHLAYRDIPKGPCKYIYVARNGRDVALSYYHLYRTYNGYQGTFAEFFDLFLRGKVECGSWFQHVRAWWSHRHDPNVLFLTYEELTRDLEGCLHRIITFCGFDVPAERLPGILECCGFAFMKQHESRFDPALESLWEFGVRLNGFLRNGRTGEGKEALTAQQEARFARAFQKQLAATGITFGSEESKSL
jgi:hypothetical protein